MSRPAGNASTSREVLVRLSYPAVSRPAGNASTSREVLVRLSYPAGRRSSSR